MQPNIDRVEYILSFVEKQTHATANTPTVSITLLYITQKHWLIYSSELMSIINAYISAWKGRWRHNSPSFSCSVNEIDVLRKIKSFLLWFVIRKRGNHWKASDLHLPVILITAKCDNSKHNPLPSLITFFLIVFFSSWWAKWVSVSNSLSTKAEVVEMRFSVVQPQATQRLWRFHFIEFVV